MSGRSNALDWRVTTKVSHIHKYNTVKTIILIVVLCVLCLNVTAFLFYLKTPVDTDTYNYAWDFGELVNFEGILKHDFSIQNKYVDQLNYSRSLATCGCEVSGIEFTKLASGEEGKVSVSLIAPRGPTTFSGQGFVEMLNERTNKLIKFTFSVKARVRRPYVATLEPSVICLGTSEKLSRYVTRVLYLREFIYDAVEPLGITSVSATRPEVTTKLLNQVASNSVDRLGGRVRESQIEITIDTSQIANEAFVEYSEIAVADSSGYETKIRLDWYGEVQR